MKMSRPMIRPTPPKASDIAQIALLRPLLEVAACRRRSRCIGWGALVGEQANVYAAVLGAAFAGRVVGDFLILADADQVEAVGGDSVLRCQILDNGDVG